MLTKEDFIVFALDDDEDFLDALALMLEAEGWKNKVFSSPADFLEAYPPKEPCIVLLDAKMPHLSGIDVLDQISKKNKTNPIIFVTGHGDIDLAIHVLTNGACNFIQKPLIPDKLFNIMQKAVKILNDNRAAAYRKALTSLTEMEFKAIKKACQGLRCREIGEALGISSRTAETHKFRAMQKLGVHSVSELHKVLTELETRNE